MEMSTSETVPDDEEEDVKEAVPKNKLTLHNLSKSSNYSRLILTWWKKDWHHIETFLE